MPYDGEQTRSWRIGIEDVSTSGGLYRGAAGTGQRWAVAMLPLRLRAGTYRFSAATYRTYDTQATQCDDAALALYSSDGVTLTRLDYKSVFGSLVASSGHYIQSADLSADPLTLTITEADLAGGTLYYLAICLRGKAGRTSSHPGLRCLPDGVGPEGKWWLSTTELDTTDPPATLSEATGEASHRNLPYLRAVMETDVQRPLAESSVFAGTAIKILVPRLLDAPSWIVARDAVVPDGQTLAIAAQIYDSAGGTAVDLAAATLDMGATDQVSFQGTDVALAAGGVEAGDEFDLGIELLPQAAKTEGDLFWVNKRSGQGGEGGTDITTISHACAAAAARRSLYTLDAGTAVGPDWIAVSGGAGATLDGLEVSARLLVIYGDSQCSTSGPAAPYRLGQALIDALPRPLSWWIAAIPGNRLSQVASGNHTAGYLRYWGNAPGIGDLVEMRGILLAIGSYGVNDIARIGGAADVTPRLARMVDALAVVIAGLHRDDNAGGNAALVIGLPPYPAGSSDMQAAVRPWNARLRDAAALAGLPYYDPYALVEANLASYIAGDNTHYTTAGAEAVAAQAVAAWQAGRVPAPSRQINVLRI